MGPRCRKIICGVPPVAENAHHFVDVKSTTTNIDFNLADSEIDMIEIELEKGSVELALIDGNSQSSLAYSTSSDPIRYR